MKQLSLFFIIFFTTIVFGQKEIEKTPFFIGETVKIESASLNETRTLNIYLPEGYSKDNNEKYPLIYLLDGSANEDFVHIAGLVQFMSLYELMPKSIVVGIANVDRKRDFTYPTTIAEDKKEYPTTGRSAKFIAFIEKELQPFINATYKTNTTKTIIGQSLGGLLATEILLKKPELFSEYIIVSPSLWWDNESLLTDASVQLKKMGSKKIFIGTGNEHETIVKDAKTLFKLLEENCKTSKLKFEYLGDENHATIMHNAVYKALEALNKK
nr:alpha/beta hydrolase-fold protein [uncultured Flavobacterium sp.]